MFPERHARAVRAERPGYRIELETGPEVETTGRTVGFDDLPAVDRTALFAVLGYPSAAEMARFERARSISIGGVLAYPDDPDAFAALVYERDGVVLDERDLTAPQRDLVETAIDETYDECAPYSDAFVDLRGALGGVGDTGEPFDYATYRDEWYAVDPFEAVA